MKVDREYEDTWKTRSEALGGMTFSQYLSSEEWIKVKKKASKRKQYQRCAKCGTDVGIELHHRSYKHIGTTHALQGLIPVCREHHQAIHDLAKEERLAVRVATYKYLKDHYKQRYNPTQ